jgi:hypothetical protein
MSMKSRLLISAALLCMSLVLVCGTSFAQNQRIGTAAATELLIPVGARDLALAGSSIANSVGAEALYWNPAGIGRMTHGAEAMFSTMSYIADIRVNYGAVTAKFGEFGIMGFSLKSLDFGNIPLTTQDDPEGLGGKTYSPTYVTLGMSYGRALTDAISAGLTAKLISERIDRVAASGFAFDVGLQYDGLVGVQGLQLGVTVKNIGPQIKFDGGGLYRSAITVEGDRPEQRYKIEAAGFELPSLIEIGVAYKGTVQDNMNYTLNGVFMNNNLYEDEYRVGGEYGIKMEPVQLFARAGYGFVPQVKTSTDRLFGATFGFGIVYNVGGADLAVDFAYRQVQLFDNNIVVAVKLGF